MIRSGASVREREGMKPPRQAANRREPEILQIGIDARTVPLRVVEGCAAALDSQPRGQLLMTLIGKGVGEIVLLLTCQRLECYAASDSPEHTAAEIVAFFRELSPDLQRDSVGIRHGQEAVVHLISVAAGLESALAGEHEILGQVRRAYRYSRMIGAVGPVLERLFQHAIESARRIRHTLGLDFDRRSLADVAIAWLQASCPNTSNLTALVIGTGGMARQMIDRLRDLKFRAIVVASRQSERARNLALKSGCAWEVQSHIPSLLPRLDLIICATLSPDVLLSEDTLGPALVDRSGRPLFIIDLGVPHNVAPAVAAGHGVRMLNMASILRAAAFASARRDEWVRQARGLLKRAAEEFAAWQRVRFLGPLLSEVRARYEETIRMQLLRKNAQARTDLEVADRMAFQIAGKLLHPLYISLKRLAVDGSPAYLEAFVRSLISTEVIDGSIEQSASVDEEMDRKLSGGNGQICNGDGPDGRALEVLGDGKGMQAPSPLVTVDQA